MLGFTFCAARDDIVIHWGEIQSVDATRGKYADGSTFLEISVDHFCGVDFRFHASEVGYAQVMAEMEKRLIGFSRAQAEAAGTWEEKLDTPPVWQRDEKLQPLEMRPPEVDTREPSPEERVQMAASFEAFVAKCEKELGRPLVPAELNCLCTVFENGRIVGSDVQPLCDLFAKRQHP